MPDIFHNLLINASAQKVFSAVSTPAGLNSWWTEKSSGEPVAGNEYELWFGPEYDWRAVVTKSFENELFELKVIKADEDWNGTLIGFNLLEKNWNTHLEFYNTGWSETSEHFKISSYCWGMYLRLLKRYLEYGEIIAYKNRLEV